LVILYTENEQAETLNVVPTVEDFQEESLEITFIQIIRAFVGTVFSVLPALAGFITITGHSHEI